MHAADRDNGLLCSAAAAGCGGNTYCSTGRTSPDQEHTAAAEAASSTAAPEVVPAPFPPVIFPAAAAAESVKEENLGWHLQQVDNRGLLY